MKFIKYIAAALLLTVAFTSCESGEGVKDGTVGKTTVQFAQDVLEGSYSSDYISVPLTISAASEEDMNSCNVSVKVIPVITNEEYEGVHNETGLEGDGNYSVTSWELNFPAYDSYYDKNDPQKYYDVDSGKWVRTVNLEVKIMDKSSDELHITFMIESTTATMVGEKKMCKVVLVKTMRDRLQGMYTVSYDEVSWLFGGENRFLDYDEGIGMGDPTQYFPVDASKYPWKLIQNVWVTDPDTGQSYFVIASDHHIANLFGAYFYGYYDAKLEKFYLYPKDFLGSVGYGADPEKSAYFMATAVYDTEESKWVDDEEKVYLDFDIKTGVLSLPEKYAFSLAAFEVDITTYEVLGFKGEITPAYKGLKFTKMK